MESTTTTEAELGSTAPISDLSQERNILILGETGVGKSTWINGFVNFLSYVNLDDAEKGDFITVIPSQFAIYNKNLDEVVVSTGTDDNESHIAGQSATQEARVHIVNVGGLTIRLIDTPGIGDTRGIEQDQKNFENVLGTLSHLKEIHGICIFLKPNNARLTVMFRFCIKELLTYLHRDAIKNILFCFTNSRGTFYRPGDTLPALQKLLTENEIEVPVCPSTVYCYDSEAYRFLAAVKNQPPVAFSAEERFSFSQSWDNSMEETKRMLKHIRDLAPHSINNTLNLNHTRAVVLKLARPFAEISRSIQINKSVMEDQIGEMELSGGTIKELEGKQTVSRTDVEIIKLNYPRTVCTNSHCVKTVVFNGIVKTEYTSVCHDRCACVKSGVPADSLGDPGLLGCWAMNNGVCRVCGHSYRAHMHVYYDSVQVERQVPDQAMVNLLKKTVSDNERKDKLIEAKWKEVKELQDELRSMEEASASFAYFLKKNAITSYNDAMEQYLTYQIREEEGKVGCGGREMALKWLTDSRDSYIRQKNILEQQMNWGNKEEGATTRVSEVDLLVKQLQGLKHSGETLKQALECIGYTQKETYKKNVIPLPSTTVGWLGE